MVQYTRRVSFSSVYFRLEGCIHRNTACFFIIWFCSLLPDCFQTSIIEQFPELSTELVHILGAVISGAQVSELVDLLSILSCWCELLVYLSANVRLLIVIPIYLAQTCYVVFLHVIIGVYFPKFLCLERILDEIIMADSAALVTHDGTQEEGDLRFINKYLLF
jgi:hypothetical protein